MHLKGAVAVAVALLVMSATAPAEAQEQWRPSVNAAARYAKERRGVEAFSVRTATRTWGWRESATYPSASVLKPMLMLAYLDREGVRDRALTNGDKRLLRPMITRSENAPANRIIGIVGTKGLRRVARRARMTNFTPVADIWGNSRITAEDQSRFFLKIDALIPERHRAYAMGLLHDIVPSQRWGFGRLDLHGWDLYFKGGWGSGTGAVDHQVALLTRADGTRLSVAILTADDGTHAYGKETLRGIAKRLLTDLPESAPLSRQPEA